MEAVMKKTRITLSLILFAIFLAYTCLCLIVDLSQTVKPRDAYTNEEKYGMVELGFSTLNTKVSKHLDYNETFYKISEYLGYLALLVGAAIGCLWLYNLVRTRSILRVAPILNASIVALALMVGFYVLFEVLKVNVRPLVLEDGLEASYPSSHTLLGLTVFGCAAMVCAKLIPDKGLGRSLCWLNWLLGAMLMLFRMLSGVHWLTDVLGGVMLSAALLYFAVYLSQLQERSVSESLLNPAE